MRNLLADLFGFTEVGGFRLVHGGYMSQNFRVETDRGPFFLKQYRNRINTIVHEIKAAEQFFADQGLPVILPVKDRYGREAFWTHGNWYGLFPFIAGSAPERTHMTKEKIVAMSEMLAKFHAAGERFTYRPFQMVRVGNPRKFQMESVELFRLLERRQPLSFLDQTIFDLLTYKRHMVEQSQATPKDFEITFDCLLHGDFQYTNLFMNTSHEITHVYDLERASLGPTGYEVARSSIINCFDSGWEEKNFAFVRSHLAAYREHRHFSYEDYERSVRFYAFNVIFTTWIEARYLIYGIGTQLDIFERHAKRVHFFTQTNLRDYCQRTFA